MNKNVLILNLINFAETHLGTEDMDLVFVSNYIYKEFESYPPFEENVEQFTDKVDDLVEGMMEYYLAKGLSPRDSELKITEIFGRIAPLPSGVNKTFWDKYFIDKESATSYLYKLGIDMYYVQKTKIDRNIEWVKKFDDGREVELTINLSKPEKNNKDIKKLLTANVSALYPKCLLCVENLGFYGNEKKDGRTNIRIVKMDINGETWYMQYSPYGYFNEHMILLSEEHKNMVIDKNTFITLSDFVEKFPHYMIGSNASLPIVGGSILNHEHYQGGRYTFPVLRAKLKAPFFEKDGVKISVVDYYNYTVCIYSKDKNKMVEYANKVSEFWNNYSDASVDVIANDGTQHNVVTPIVKKVDGVYYCYCILRNNNTSEQYPDGIFHVHPEYHAIKHEGIGLIEAMGRFILPARLKRQLAVVDDFINNKDFNKSMLDEEYAQFEGMINYCKENKMNATDYVSMVGREILKQVSVFKEDEAGFTAAKKFENSLSNSL